MSAQKCTSPDVPQPSPCQTELAETTSTMAIGLDFGAASTRIAMLDACKLMPSVIRNDLSNESTSTVVAFPSNEARCFGETAVTKQITRPHETVTDLKEWLLSCESAKSKVSEMDHELESGEGNGKDIIRQIGHIESHPVQVAAYFLKSIFQFVPGNLRDIPVCVAVPSCAVANSIAALRQACLLAGVAKNHITIARNHEAVAAYFHHTQFNQLHDTIPTFVTIIDVGQSCSYALVLKVTKTSIEKIAMEATPTGSGDIDALMCMYVYEELERKYGKDARLRGDAKVFRKILRACRKAKEILSTVDETHVQVDGLTSEIDVNVLVTRAIAERCATALRSALRNMLERIKPYVVSCTAEGATNIINTNSATEAKDEESNTAKVDDSATATTTQKDESGNENENEEKSNTCSTINSNKTEPRVEVIGGGWRTLSVSSLIKDVLEVSRLGVSLDANLAVAEGCAIMAEVLKRADSPMTPSIPVETNTNTTTTCPRHPAHEVQLIHFEATNPDSIIMKPLSAQDEAAVAEWEVLETHMAAADASIHARLDAINVLDSLVLQSLEFVDQCECDEARKEAIKMYFNDYNEYLRENCRGDSTETISAKTAEVLAHIAQAFPEIEQCKSKRREEERRKEEELRKLAEQEKQREDVELKSDPQRLREAQRRSEQGQKLFKEEHWAEAQTRFVQALAILNEIYDTQNEENKATKERIALSCYLNTASCSIKQKLWRLAVNNATSAIELSSNNAKAFYRRGQGRFGLKEYDEAVADLEIARKLSSNNDEVVQALTSAKNARDAEKAKAKAMFAKMFK